jgi:hypothetical protein
MDDDVEPLVFSEEQLDVIAQVIADLRAEFTDAIAEAVASMQSALDKLREDMGVREEVAEQRGQLRTVMTILGVGDDKAKTIGEVVRKVREPS